MTRDASLAALDERIAAVNDVLNAASVLTWDSRTMMPSGGAETRGHQIATLTRLARDLLSARQAAVPGAEPWRFALDRLRLEGIDTDTWTPGALLWKE